MIIFEFHDLLCIGITRHVLYYQNCVSVTISEALPHPFNGQENGLEKTDSQLKSDLPLATNQHQGLVREQGEPQVTDFAFRFYLWGGRRRTESYTLLMASTDLRSRKDRLLSGSKL